MTSTVLITGASSGIGRATAQRFQQAGWNVVATMRNPADAGELAALDRLLVLPLDVTDDASITQAVAAANARFGGGIDVLVNNAGYGAYGPLEAFDKARLQRQFDTNVLGLLRTTQAVLPAMRQRGSGAVVNISSMGGRFAFPLGTPYHASKFAVEGLSEALHYELAAIGLRVKLVAPGMVRTDFGGRSFDFAHDPALAAYQPLVDALMASFAPLSERAADAAAVADVIYAAATDASPQLRYVAGADAQALLQARRELDDEAFFALMRTQMALDPA